MLRNHKEEFLFIGGEYKFVVIDEDGNIISTRPATRKEIAKAEGNAEKQAERLPKIDGEDPARW